MRWRKARKYRIGLNEGGARNYHLLSLGESAVDFVGGLIVMFMPARCKRGRFQLADPDAVPIKIYGRKSLRYSFFFSA